jgi:hypothetical protein
MSDSIDGDFIDELPPIPGAQIEPNRFRIHKPLVYLGLMANCRCCGKVLDLGLWISGGLGPTLIECPRCHAIAHSHRHEWADMSWSERVAYLLASALYVVVTLAIVAASLGPLRYGVPGVPAYLFPYLWAGTVIPLQMLRIRNSLARTATFPRIPRRAFLGSLDLGIQWKFLVFVLVAPRLLLSAWVWLWHHVIV